MSALWPQLSDDRLVSRILAGEAELFEIVVRRYNQRLYRTAMAIVRDPVEAEDVLQDTYLNAFAHLRQFAGRARFSTWLTRIAVNEALARLAKRTRSPLSFRDWEDDLPAPATDPEHGLVNQSLKEFLETAVGGLTPPYRSVFVLREIEGLSTAETASVLDISPENVKVRLHRARAFLKAVIHARTGLTSRTLYEFMGARCDAVVAAVMMGIARQRG